MTAIAKTNSDVDSRITAYADAIVRNAHVMNGVKHIEIPCSLLRLIRVLKSSSPRKLLAVAMLTFPDRGESSALTACLEGMMQK